MKENHSTRANTRKKGWVSLGISLGVYVIIFWLLVDDLGPHAVALALVPVFIGSWQLGILRGVISTTVALLLSILILSIEGDISIWPAFFHNGFLGFVALYVVSIIFGYLGRMDRQHKEAISTRVRVAEDFEKQAASLTQLANITNKVLDAENMYAVLHVLAGQTRIMFEADDCLISLWNESQKRYYPRAAEGQMKDILENLPPRAENPMLSKLQTGDILVFAKPGALEETGADFRVIYPQGTVLLLPLITGEEKLGFLYLLYAKERNFSPNELTYAKLTSRQISLAISKGALLEKAQEQLDELKALHAVALTMAEATDESSLLKRATESLSTSLYGFNVAIVLIDHQMQEIKKTASYQVDESDIFKVIPLGQGVTGKVVKTGQLERINDVRNVPYYIAALPSTRSEICVPIKTGEKVSGVINVESDELNAFSERDEQLLTTVANQLSVALIRLDVEREQARRIKEIARSNSLIHALTQVAAQMEMSSEPNEVMHLMGTKLKELGFQTLVALFDPGSQDLVLRYTSLEETIVKKLERFSKTNMSDLRIPVDALPARLNLSGNLQPIIVRDYISVIAALLKGFSAEVIRRMLARIFDPDKMILGHFPLIYQEKILGFLWLWSDILEEEDLPTLTVFANQVASALENARLFADVQRLALTDGLTGLHTRRHFFELAYEEFYRSRRYNHPLSILMLDLDHFKKVNDTYGHAAGDTALEKTAATCKSLLRSQDIIGRYGGEEIVILLSETNIEAAEMIAKRVWKAIREMDIPTKKGTINLTVSGGIAGDNIEEQNLIDMIEAADQAMYAAKEAGRDQIVVATQIPVQETE